MIFFRIRKIAIIMLLMFTFNFGLVQYNQTKFINPSIVYAESTVMDKVYLAGITMLALFTGAVYNSTQQAYEMVSHAFEVNQQFLDFCKGMALVGGAKITSEVIDMMTSIRNYFQTVTTSQETFKLDGYEVYIASGSGAITVPFGADYTSGMLEFFINTVNTANVWAKTVQKVTFNTTQYYQIETNVSRVSEGSQYRWSFNIVRNLNGVKTTLQTIDLGLHTSALDIGTVTINKAIKLILTATAVKTVIDGVVVDTQAVSNPLFKDMTSSITAGRVGVKVGGQPLVYNPTAQTFDQPISNDKVLDKTVKTPDTADKVINRTLDEILDLATDIGLTGVALQTVRDLVDSISKTMEGIRDMVKPKEEETPYVDTTDREVPTTWTDVTDKDIDLGERPEYKPPVGNPFENLPKFKVPFLSSIIALIIALIIFVGKLIVMINGLLNIGAIPPPNADIVYGIDYVRGIEFYGVTIMGAVSSVATFIFAIKVYKAIKKVI